MTTLAPNAAPAGGRVTSARTLMPYLMAGHFLIDLSSAYFFLALS